MTVILLSVCFIKSCTNPVLLSPIYLDAVFIISFYRSIVDSLNSLELIASPSSCLVAFWQLKINEYERMNEWNLLHTTSIYTELSYWHLHRSQCSTLVRNTVVSATFKVNGIPPILGYRSPLTPWPIHFDTGDYVGDMTAHAKNGKNRPRGAGPANGWNVKFTIPFGLFFNFFTISCPPLETTFLHRSTPDDMFRWGWFPRGLIVRVKNFSPSKPPKSQIFGPFLDLEIFARNALQRGRYRVNYP